MFKYLIYSCIIIFVTTSCSSELEYYNSQVEFFTQHPDVAYLPAEFELVTEQVLVKAEHRAIGAVFETLQETHLVKDAHSIFEISDTSYLHIVIDAGRNTVAEVPCFNFKPLSEIERITVPTQYTTRTYQRTLDPGVGKLIPASYKTISYWRLVNDAKLVEGEAERESIIITVRVPYPYTTLGYLRDQFEQHGASSCSGETSFRIIN